MTDNSLNAVTTFPVPAKAIADVLSTVPFDRRNTRLHDAIILTIARKHGGDEMLAAAIRVRIQLLGMLIHADETLEPIVAGLTRKPSATSSLPSASRAASGAYRSTVMRLRKQSGSQPSQRMPNDIVPTIIFNQRRFS